MLLFNRASTSRMCQTTPTPKKPAKVGSVVFAGQVEGDKEDGPTPYDISVIELDPTVEAAGKVFVGKNSREPVLGFKTRAEVAALKNAATAQNPLRLCISGRSGGWGCFPVKEVNDFAIIMEFPFTTVEKEVGGKTVEVNILKTGYGTENTNPHFIYGGNSGSVFWYRDPNNSGYWAAGLLSGSTGLTPMDKVFEFIKTGKNYKVNADKTKNGLELVVCVDPAPAQAAAGAQLLQHNF